MKYLLVVISKYKLEIMFKPQTIKTHLTLEGYKVPAKEIVCP